MESLNGLMDQSMKDSLWKIIFMGKVGFYSDDFIIGMYTWNDKRQFIGDWKNNKMDGEGTFIWPDERKYQGQYKDDKKEGYGVFEW
jgi:hypothetical protein